MHKRLRELVPSDRLGSHEVEAGTVAFGGHAISQAVAEERWESKPSSTGDVPRRRRRREYGLANVQIESRYIAHGHVHVARGIESNISANE